MIHEEIFVVGILAFSELAFSFFFSSLCKIGNLKGEATKEESLLFSHFLWKFETNISFKILQP